MGVYNHLHELTTNQKAAGSSPAERALESGRFAAKTYSGHALCPLLHVPHTATGTTTGHGRHALKSTPAVMLMVNPTRAAFALAKERLDTVQIGSLSLGL
jgi:hypothetical protein